MILHPGILALLVGEGLALLLLLYAVGTGVGIAWGWDYGSSGERQLGRERRTLLVSVLARTAIGFLVFSGLLFLYTVEEIHPLFAGAMCATGTLNANPVGWSVLATKGALLLLGVLWMAANRLDSRAEDYPLVKWKYPFLALLLPLAVADLLLMGRFFLGLHPEIVTSCCGSLFSGGSRVASSLAQLPLRPALGAFYGSGIFFLLALLVARYRRGFGWRLLLAGAAPVWGLSAAAGIVAFVAPYFYQLPTHHCPFDLLQGAYGYVGYPLYGLLAAGLLGGVLAAAAPLLRRSPSLEAPLRQADRRWVLLGLGSTVGFLLLASAPLLFGGFTLFGY